ncbi:MAG: AAA family ATPase [Planctomycetota bacterium]
MYESQFLLKRRPFAATPDPKCFLASGPIQAALDELVVCVEQGQGVAVVSAPAGTGKTLLCERLRVELADRFETVFLRHASFLTRRALLQTILADLNHSYHRQDEQELRLELIPAIRALSPRHEALVLLCDESHMLSEDLLEELRMLSDLSEHGRPLVRLVLVGQPSLEETLARPGLEALNQRIRAHVCLESFDRTTSQDYIDYRLTWAGGRTGEIFSPEAIEMVVRASEGVPRCINQLCDHALLLAYVAEQKPVPASTIREALQDLRQLPLHWNESLIGDSADSDTAFEPDPASQRRIEESTREIAPRLEQGLVGDVQTFEFGADLPMSKPVEYTSFDPMDDVEEMSADEDEESFANGDEFDADEMDDTVDFEPPVVNTRPPRPLFPLVVQVPKTVEIVVPVRSNEVVEEMVCDRYAAIDGGFPIPQANVSPVVSGPEESIESTLSTASTEPSTEIEISCDAAECVNSVSEDALVENFDAVCSRLEDRLPKVVENSAWDTTALNFEVEATVPVADAKRQDTSEQDDWDSIEAELGVAVCAIAKEIHSEIPPQTDGTSALERLQGFLEIEKPDAMISMEIGFESKSHTASRQDGVEQPHPSEDATSGRPFRNLFSRLRRKQQGL